MRGSPADLYDEGHLHYFTFRSLTRMLTLRCGFSRVERVPYASAPHVFGKRGSLRAGAPRADRVLRDRASSPTRETRR